MHPTVNESPRRSAPLSEADQLLDLMSTPTIAEMAVWSDVPAGNDADCEHVACRASRAAPATLRTLLEDVDGHAANSDDPLDPWPASRALYEAARARRAAMMAALVRSGIRIVHDTLRRVRERYQRRRDTRAIYGALSGLDDRTLRDLGFHRCEIWSVAAEATGEAEHTRLAVRVLPRTPA